MKQILVIVLVVLVVGTTGIFFFVGDKENVLDESDTTLPSFDGKNTTFTIDENPVTLVNGMSSVAVGEGMTSVMTTRYFGNESYGDLNGDGLEDVAFLVVQESGGSGVFYYVVVALQTTNGYATTNAFFVGDRIAPQTTQIQSDAMELRVNFAERRPDEPMTAVPSMGATLYLKVTPDGVLEGLMQ